MRGFLLALVGSLALLSACQASPQPLMAYALQNPDRTLNGFAAPRFQGLNTQRDLMALMQRFHAPLLQRNPALIEYKYREMAVSPFVFYRATAFLYYHDLRQESALSQGVAVPLQGDFHLENMGTYLTSQGSFAYDANDFDEAVTGPHTWDLARLTTSLHLAAEEVGIGQRDRQALNQYFLQRYIALLQRLQQEPGLLQQPLDERYLDKEAGKQVRQARERFDRSAWLAKYSRNGRFVHSDKLLPVSASEARRVQQALQLYLAQRREPAGFFTIKDIASRIAGKGSLGRYRYVVLVEGASGAAQDDLILEVKEAITPSASWAGIPAAPDEGQRIVQAYRQALPGADPYLGATRLDVHPAFVRELLDKETVKLDKLTRVKDYESFLDSVALIMARLHARSGQIPALLNQTAALAPDIQRFADRYFEQVKADHALFRRSL